MGAYPHAWFQKMVSATPLRWWLSLVCVAFALACSEDSEPEAESDTGTSSSNRTSGTSGPTWAVSTIEGGDHGLHIQIATSGERVGVAYYVTGGMEDGVCPLDSEAPPIQIRWPLRYAELGTDGVWQIEEVTGAAILGVPPGLDLQFAPDGTATIAALTGDPFSMGPIGYCGAHDVGLYTSSNGTWQAEVAVAGSGEAATGDSASDFGAVVGYWPSLAFDDAGQPAVAYKDVHSGSIMSDDLRRADLELAWRQGGWRAVPVDFGKGAGNFNKLLFDGQTPYIVYYNPFEDIDEPALGIWATRSTDNGATWERVQLFPSGSPTRPDAVFDPDAQELHVIYYNTKGYPELATLENGDDFASVNDGWALSDIGESRYDEGYSPSIAIDSSGNLAVAYRRCARAIEGLGNCTSGDDALIFAYRDGPTWEHEVVDEGEDGFCGEDLELTFDNDDRAVIAYSCQILDDEGLLETQVKYARRNRDL